MWTQNFLLTETHAFIVTCVLTSPQPHFQIQLCLNNEVEIFANHTQMKMFIYTCTQQLIIKLIVEVEHSYVFTFYQKSGENRVGLM